MKKYKQYLSYLCLLSLVVSSILPASAVIASSTRLHLDTPRTVVAGQSFTVRVLANAQSGGGNRSIIALDYPSSRVSVTGTSMDNSVFGGNTFTNDIYANGQGRITHLAYPIPAPQGQSLLVFTATFRANQTGAVNFSFGGDSVVNDSATQRSGATVNIVDKNCPDGQTGTPPNCSTPTPPPSQPQPSNPGQQNPRPAPSPSRPNTSQPVPNTRNEPAQVYPGRVIHPAIPTSPPPPSAETPARDTNPDISSPDIVNQQVLDSELDIINLRTATRLDRAELLWEVNHPASTTFTYGDSANNLDSTIDPDVEENTSFYVSVRDLEPGKTYYYSISGERTDSNETLTHSGTFSTKGYGLEIKTLQQDGQPLTNAQISFDGTGGSISTDEEGVAYVQVVDGEYDITVSKGGHSSTHKITVEKVPIDETGNAEVQQVEIKTSATSTSTSEVASRSGPSVVAYIVTIMIGVILMTVVGFVIYFRKQKREKRQKNQPGVVVIENDWTPPPGHR